MLGSYGLQTYIWNNRLKSLLLLAGFPVLLLLICFGFAVLIFLHEAGHFVAAKAVGMRVERFSLFFGPMPIKRTWGETEYGIGIIPLGGYVRITGSENKGKGNKRLEIALQEQRG